MSAPYKRASQHGLLWVVVVFIGIGVGVVIGVTLPKTVHWWQAFPAFGGPILLAIALCVILTVRIKRKRIAGIQADIERDNFILDPKPPDERKASVFAPVAELQSRLDLRNGAQGIVWLALNTNPPTDTCIFEHSHITGSGKTTQEHIHTVCAWIHPGPEVPDFGGLAIYKPQLLQRAAFKKRHTDPITTGDPRFDKHWLTFGNADTVKQFLTDSVRIELANSPRGESWHIGPTWIACAFKGALDARNLDNFRRRAQEVITRFAASSPSGRGWR
jgi:hypothetical protein